VPQQASTDQDTHAQQDATQGLPADNSACCTALDTAVPPLHTLSALLACSLSAIYNKPALDVIELTDAFEHAFAAATSKPDAQSSLKEPKLFCKAMSSPDTDKWYKAAAAEMQAHLKSSTWELVKLPAGQKAIGSKWVFKVKRNANSSVECYKA
jgi:hypothetical protein